MSENTKLRVDFNNGTFDGEGDPEFLRRMYEDFGARLEKLRASRGPRPAADDSEDEELEGAETIDEAVKVRRKRRAARPTAKSSAADKVMNYSPTLVKDLNLSGLNEFYEPWAPKNHPERILLFAHFLDSALHISPCTADQIFTCYRYVKDRVPEAFVQAFRDASGNRHGYIDYKSPTDISVTIVGLNHLEHGGLKKKAPNDVGR